MKTKRDMKELLTPIYDDDYISLYIYMLNLFLAVLNNCFVDKDQIQNQQHLCTHNHLHEVNQIQERKGEKLDHQRLMNGMLILKGWLGSKH